MRASSICPACNHPGTLDEACPNCGRNPTLPQHSLLGLGLAAAIHSRVEKEWRLASQTHSQLSLSLQQFAEKVLRITEKHGSGLATGEVSPEQAVGQLLDNLKWS